MKLHTAETVKLTVEVGVNGYVDRSRSSRHIRTGEPDRGTWQKGPANNQSTPGSVPSNVSEHRSNETTATTLCVATSEQYRKQ